jgi:hypothetical protein
VATRVSYRGQMTLFILVSLFLLISLVPAAHAADSTTQPEDTTPPVLTLEGPQQMYLPAGEAFSSRATQLSMRSMVISPQPSRSTER